jgi:hypothetical protein
MITFLKFQWSSSIIRIALLSDLSYPQILPNYTNLFFCLLNKFRSKDLSSSSLVQNRGVCTSCHIESQIMTSSDCPVNYYMRTQHKVDSCPATTMLKGTSSQHVFQYLISPFSLSISLRMIGCTKIQLRIHILMKTFPKF